MKIDNRPGVTVDEAMAAVRKLLEHDGIKLAELELKCVVEGTAVIHAVAVGTGCVGKLNARIEFTDGK